MDAGKPAFNLHGSIRACVVDIVCGGAVGNISGGPRGAGGVGGCVEVLGVNIGGGVKWNELDDPYLWPFDGCRWTPFRIDVRAVRTAAGDYTIDVKRGQPSPALKLFGQGGPPQVSVRGPGGQFLNDTNKGLDMSGGGKIRILRFKGNKYAGPFTVVGLQNAEPGRYTVSTLPGSPAVSRVARATDQPDAKVSGRVTGKGRRRVLRYNVRDRVRQKVIFQEVTSSGRLPDHRLHHPRRQGPDSLQLRPRRRAAQDPRPVRAGQHSGRAQAGHHLPAPVDQAQAPAPAARAPPRQQPARELAQGLGRHSLRGRRAALRPSHDLQDHPPHQDHPAGAGLALAAGSMSGRSTATCARAALARSRRFKAKGRQPSPFRPLLSCRVGGARIVCTEQNQRCYGRTATISASAGRGLRGTRGNDVIVGGSGSDRIDGRGGNDIICSGGGNDRITGGSGNDSISGGAGRDRITGQAGNDRIDGGRAPTASRAARATTASAAARATT